MPALVRGIPADSVKLKQEFWGSNNSLYSFSYFYFINLYHLDKFRVPCLPAAPILPAFFLVREIGAGVESEMLNVNLPPVPFGFFCRFEDNLARKLPVPLDFGTD